MQDTKVKPQQIDQKSKKRNRTIIGVLIGGTFVLNFLPFVLVGNYTPDAGQLGYISGQWFAMLFFCLLAYFLGRWKLQPTFEENKKKFNRGIIAVIFILVVHFIGFIGHLS